MEKVKKEGVIPDTISILVAPNDYNRYIILKYNFLNEIYKLNEDIIDKRVSDKYLAGVKPAIIEYRNRWGKERTTYYFYGKGLLSL